MVVKTAIDLYFRDGADPDAEAEQRYAQQVAFESRSRVFDVPRLVDPALDQHAPGTDRLRVFGHQRPLLCQGRGWKENESAQDTKEITETRMRHQEWFALSMRMVTGPSLTSSTRFVD